MKILALDSTAQTAAVAVCDDEKLLSEFTVNTGLTHSETLLPLVENALKCSSTDISDIELFAMSEGPGSFTGVRIGAATLKGLAFGRNLPCVGVSTLEALAYNLEDRKGLICPCMNARRQQVYNALFMSDGNGNLERLCADRAISITELGEELKKYNDTVIFLCGDGYTLVKNTLTDISFAYVRETLILQSGYSVAQCALIKYRQGQFTTDRELTPVYLRLPQAERERLEKEGKTVTE